MKQGQPSKTAEWVARMRAAHQVLDAPPHVLEDPLAPRLLSAEQREALSRPDAAQQTPDARATRAFVVARSRYTEDLLARAVAAGVRQYVVLGAGLDTFAYRNPFPDLRLFEVDHPDTQAWKRERLAIAGIAEPRNLTFAAVDLESQSLVRGLAAAGFQGGEPAFFAWLGVTPYITRESFRDTLAFLSARPPGSGVAFDYATPRRELEPAKQHTLDDVTRRVEGMGEPFQRYFSQEELAAEFDRVGFADVEDLDSEALHLRYFALREDGLETRSAIGRLASAWVRGR